MEKLVRKEYILEENSNTIVTPSVHKFKRKMHSSKCTQKLLSNLSNYSYGYSAGYNTVLRRLRNSNFCVWLKKGI